MCVALGGLPRAGFFVPYIDTNNKLGQCKKQKPARGKPPNATHIML